VEAVPWGGQFAAVSSVVFGVVSGSETWEERAPEGLEQLDEGVFCEVNEHGWGEHESEGEVFEAEGLSESTGVFLGEPSVEALSGFSSSALSTSFSGRFSDVDRAGCAWGPEGSVEAQVSMVEERVDAFSGEGAVGEVDEGEGAAIEQSFGEVEGHLASSFGGES
jgi:hypothetical protein